MADRIMFNIPIGDWYGDGHGQCEWKMATAAKPLEDVRKAYFLAKEKLPAFICPENFVNNYEDGTVPDKVIKELKKRGFPIDKERFYVSEMARYVAWFINQGDPDCDVQVDDETQLDMLPFYGLDKKKRHISFIGYGLLG